MQQIWSSKFLQIAQQHTLGVVSNVITILLEI